MLGRIGRCSAVLLVVLSAAACTSASRPADAPAITASPRPACGRELPASISIPAAAAPVNRPAPDTPPLSDTQVVRSWVTPLFTLEARWPPDPRTLQATPGLSDASPLFAGWHSLGPDELSVDVSNPADTIGNTVLSNTDFTLMFVADPRVRAMSGECGLLQLRVMRHDGQRMTVGVRLAAGADGPQIIDLGPLVDRHATLDAAIGADRVLLCPGVVGSVAEVRDAPSAASPAEALRAFLASVISAAVPRSSSPRPFDETTLTANRTVRYEQFVEWTTFVTVTVGEVADGWDVIAWSTGSC